MTKEDILKLYIADLNNLVADSDAKRSRIIDLEDELEALKQGQTLPIDSASKSCFPEIKSMSAKVFTLANELAIKGYGNASVKLHTVHNGMIDNGHHYSC